jgi:hypothetical protein
MLLNNLRKMKKYYTLLILLLSFWSNAQNGITYQAVILNPNTEELPGADNSRLPLVNQNITLQFKILNATSNIDYQETINTLTDAFGMVNVIIGTGTRKAGIASQFSAISWDGSPKTLIVALDPTGDSTHFIEISNQPFTYVPYALYAAHTGVTGTQGPAGSNGLDGKTVLNGTTNPSASIGTNGDFYINTATNSLFGPKANGWWGNGVALVGPQGIQGPQGPAGTNGTNGSNGLSAYQIWLNAGNTGTEAQFLTALRGATGAQGSQGIQGIQGATGLTGATGPQGPAGTNGTNGTNGSNGLSAYQIWLNAGNTGPEAQFLTALRGATGAQGQQGIQGATGSQGIAGNNGANGLDGKTVLNGTQSPTASTGNNGDFYINTTTSTLFGPKTSGTWGSGVSLVGPQGAAGTNGKNTLVNTTTETAGANCASGGTKIEVGIDANSNGILDSSEVNSSLTKYVCNGVNIGSNSSGASLNYNNSNIINISGINIPYTFLTNIDFSTTKYITVKGTGKRTSVNLYFTDSNNNPINVYYEYSNNGGWSGSCCGVYYHATDFGNEINSSFTLGTIFSTGYYPNDDSTSYFYKIYNSSNQNNIKIYYSIGSVYNEFKLKQIN